MGICYSKILSLNAKNTKIYFNNTFIGYAKSSYNREQWQVLINRIAAFYKVDIHHVNIACRSANFYLRTGHDNIRVLVNHGATHLFLSVINPRN